MNKQLTERINKAISSFEDSQQDPSILVLGATGVGKSTMINAILGQKVHEVKTVESTTRSFATNCYRMQDGSPIYITDSPGYGEVGHDEAYSADVVAEAAKHHVLLLVLKADEKGYQRDLDILSQVVRDPEFDCEKPVLVVLNQIDKVKPLREWAPPYDLDAPETPQDSEKLRIMRDKVALVRKQLAGLLGETRVVVCPAMSDPEEGEMFGIDTLKLNLFQLMPEVVKFRFARLSRFAESASEAVLEQIEAEADRIIRQTAVTVSAAVAVNPIPGSDIALLLPMQITMIIKIGSLYGTKVDRQTAPEVIAAMGVGLGARALFQQVISFVPGWKNIIGPPYAAAATYGLGQVAKRYFRNGRGLEREALCEMITSELQRRQDEEE